MLDQYKAAHEGVVRLLGVPQEDQLSLAENVNSLQLSVAGVRDAALGVERLIPRLEESIARQVDQQTKDLHEAINSYAARLNDGADRQEQLLTRTVGELGTFGPQIGAELGQHVAGHVEQLGVILLSLQAGIDSLGEATTRLTEDHGHEQIVTRASCPRGASQSRLAADPVCVSAAYDRHDPGARKRSPSPRCPRSRRTTLLRTSQGMGPWTSERMRPDGKRRQKFQSMANLPDSLPRQ